VLTGPSFSEQNLLLVVVVVAVVVVVVGQSYVAPSFLLTFKII
jgi:hypothetical protein